MSELRDAIAGMIYRKVLARPDRFPPDLIKRVSYHQNFWKDRDGLIPPRALTCADSELFRKFITALEPYSEQLPEWLAEGRD